MLIDPVLAGVIASLAGVIASCATVIVMIISLRQTSSIIREMRTAREGQATPVLTLTPGPDLANTVTVTNHGSGIAKDVTLTLIYEGSTAIPEKKGGAFQSRSWRQQRVLCRVFPRPCRKIRSDRKGGV